MPNLSHIIWYLSVTILKGNEMWLLKSVPIHHRFHGTCIICFIFKIQYYNLNHCINSMMFNVPFAWPITIIHILACE